MTLQQTNAAYTHQYLVTVQFRLRTPPAMKQRNAVLNLSTLK